MSKIIFDARKNNTLNNQNKIILERVVPPVFREMSELDSHIRQLFFKEQIKFDALNLARKSGRDLEIITPNKGLVLRAPNGTRWRITVDSSGVLTTTSL